MRAARSTIHNNLNLLKLRMTSEAVTVVHVQNCEALLLLYSAAVDLVSYLESISSFVHSHFTSSHIQEELALLFVVNN